MSQPAHDRWNHKPTPLLGGVAIAAGTLAASLPRLSGNWVSSSILLAAVGLFVLGLIDDRSSLSATTKLVGSLVVGAVLVHSLGQTATQLLPAPLVVVAVIWFAGVVHGFNLLDNIDGLAAGVGAVTASAAALVLEQAGATVGVIPLVALAGALVGFLPWNAHPARIFMGDGGSLFIGAIIGGCSLIPWIGSAPPNPFARAAMAVALLIPIGEAAFVTTLRWMAGRRPTRGGIDHPSHRLVAIGFSQRRSVVILYLWTLAAAAAAVWLARSGPGALPGTALLLVGLGLGAIHMAQVPTYDGEDFAAFQSVPFGSVFRNAFVRSHAAQVLLDLVLITVSYYAAYRLRFEGEALGLFLPSFAASLPIVLVCKLAAHYGSGLYRRSWMTFGVTDLGPVFRAIAIGTTASVLAATYLYRFERFSRGVFIIDALLLLVAVLATRLSFRLMAHAAVVQSSQAKRVLICGAKERGQLLAREMLLNTAWGLNPVGFVDGAAPSEHSLLGVRVYSSLETLPELVRRLRVDQVHFSGDAIETAKKQDALRLCCELGVPVRELVFEIREPGARSDSGA